MYSSEKDSELKKISHLKWFPWIGNQFSAQEDRLLIVGESQYAKGESLEEYQKDLAIVENPMFTRNAIEQTQINKDYKHLPLDNLLNSLLGNYDSSKVWSKISFYNFVQRTMNYGLGNMEVPKPEDFDEGWKTFIEVVKIIKPTDCIFIGVSAATSFERMMDYLGVQRSERIELSPINGVKPRIASVTINGTTTRITFIKHSSSYFSPNDWRPILQENHPKIVKLLQT